MDGISGIITVFSIVAAFYGALLTVFMLILSALWLRMGNVQQELGGVQEGVNLLREHMQRSNDQLREDIHISQREFREEMLRSNDQLREDIHISQREFREEMLRTNNQLREDIHISQRELREDMQRSHNQLREEMVQLRQDMQRSQDELREDFQRGHNQLMRAILAHSHRDDGRPTFDLPPDFEPTPADD
jgi:DNA anti-recombination protein RmuC